MRRTDDDQAGAAALTGVLGLGDQAFADRLGGNEMPVRLHAGWHPREPVLEPLAALLAHLLVVSVIWGVHVIGRCVVGQNHRKIQVCTRRSGQRGCQIDAFNAPLLGTKTNYVPHNHVI